MSSAELINEFSQVNEFFEYDTNMAKNRYQTKIFAAYSSLNVLA